jgi:hypothetical protein
MLACPSVSSGEVQDVPLPEGITLCPVSVNDPPAVKELIGVWRGRWDNYGDQNTALVVRCIDPPEAKVSYGWAVYKGAKAPENAGGWEDLDAEYIPGEEPVIRFRGKRVDIQFTLKHGKLIGWFYHARQRRSNYCTMEKTDELTGRKDVLEESTTGKEGRD